MPLKKGTKHEPVLKFFKKWLNEWMNEWMKKKRMGSYDQLNAILHFSDERNLKYLVKNLNLLDI